MSHFWKYMNCRTLLRAMGSVAGIDTRTHNTRLHFHEPPTGADIADLDLASLHPLDVYSTVFEAIEQRIESLW
jgi:hypothetical protein